MMKPWEASEESVNVLWGGTKHPLLQGAVCGGANVTWWS